MQCKAFDDPPARKGKACLYLPPGLDGLCGLNGGGDPRQHAVHVLRRGFSARSNAASERVSIICSATRCVHFRGGNAGSGRASCSCRPVDASGLDTLFAQSDVRVGWGPCPDRLFLLVCVSDKAEMSFHIFLLFCTSGQTRGESGGEMPLQAGEIVPGRGGGGCHAASSQYVDTDPVRCKSGRSISNINICVAFFFFF